MSGQGNPVGLAGRPDIPVHSSPAKLHFISSDRMTVKNLEIEEAKEKRREVERKKLAEERKKYTLSMIEKDAKKDFEMERDENALLGKIPISSEMPFRNV